MFNIKHGFGALCATASLAACGEVVETAPLSPEGMRLMQYGSRACSVHSTIDARNGATPTATVCLESASTTLDALHTKEMLGHLDPALQPELDFLVRLGEDVCESEAANNQTILALNLYDGYLSREEKAGACLEAAAMRSEELFGE